MACKIRHDLLGGFASIKEYNQIGNSDLFCLCQVLLHKVKYMYYHDTFIYLTYQ